MFTGIVEGLGEVIALIPKSEGKVITLSLPFNVEESNIGQSISVNGVCLTLTKTDKNKGEFFISQTTLKTTNLGLLKSGTVVNLERPLRLNQGLSGHILTGHIDAMGDLQEISGERIRFSIPCEIKQFLIDKGSIGIDGISLTIASLGMDNFWISVIPHTKEHTNLKYRRVGDRVNIEVDLISKYIWKALETKQMQKPESKKEGMTKERLFSMGDF